MSDSIIYLNNAATSWPKPDRVVEKLIQSTTQQLGAPGRGSAGVRAERALFEARESVAEFIGAGDSSRVIFTCNATAALNLAILGLPNPGDHIVTTSMDHNSVARPLARLEDKRGVLVTRVDADREGIVTASSVLEAVRPETALVILTHASNVTGTIQPVEEVSLGLRSLGENRPRLLVDAAQTAGVLPIDVERTGIDLLAVPGHKTLYGPYGTGFLYVAPDLALDPIFEGGTGGQSTSRRQPDLMPERFESGTPNIPGIIALGEAIHFVRERGLEKIRQHETSLFNILVKGLKGREGITLYGPCDPLLQVAVLSFRVEGMDPAAVGGILEEAMGIQTRVGLHCSPFSHQTIGTYPEGTVRISPGLFNTEDHVLALTDGIDRIQEYRSA